MNQHYWSGKRKKHHIWTLEILKVWCTPTTTTLLGVIVPLSNALKLISLLTPCFQKRLKSRLQVLISARQRSSVSVLGKCPTTQHVFNQVKLSSKPTPTFKTLINISTLTCSRPRMLKYLDHWHGHWHLHHKLCGWKLSQNYSGTYRKRMNLSLMGMTPNDTR